jgi:hypothetical protein
MHSQRLFILLTGVILILSGCGSNSRFPTEKRFWTPEDYDEVIWQIEYRTPKGEEYPRFSNVESAIVIQKLVDPQNYEVVLDDTELGLNYRTEVASAFFQEYQSLLKAYRAMDIQDKYVYAQELVEIEKFGLGLQVKYFRLGNDRIIEQADSPASVAHVLKSNEENIVGNFIGYLDNIGEEKYYSTYASLLADGINLHFYTLIEKFPKANYTGMLNKANLMLEKTSEEETKQALTKLISKLESMKEAEPASS